MDDRLTALEIKVSYLEKALDDLNAVVREVNDDNTQLRKQVKELRDAMTSPAPLLAMNDDPPPHY